MRRKRHESSAGQRRGRRRLMLEVLEARRVLTEVSAIAHTFRAEDFSINGTFTYQQRTLDELQYIDTISNGRYTSSSGRVEWTSPTAGTGFYIGTATGDGRDSVEFNGRRNCSEYGIEEKGKMEFAIDAGKSKLSITGAESSSARYTYYRDLTGGHCSQPNPPWSRFFNGATRNFTGSFNPANHQVTVQYNEANPSVTVNAPAAEIVWKTTTATDLILSAVPIHRDPPVPNGWEPVSQTTSPPAPLPFLDLANGELEVKVQVTGKPIRTATPQTAVGVVRFFWASSETDLTGDEIILDTGTAGVFWNSSLMQATIKDFPAPPPSAKWVRVSIAAATSVDSNAANSSQFVRIGEFQARSSTGPTVNEDDPHPAGSDSVLHPQDRSDPAIRVFAYRSASALGAAVDVLDDRGAFSYDATAVSSLQSLAVGESLTDTIRFLAIKSQSLVSEGTLTLTVEGRNDDPIAVDDPVAATNFHSLTIAPAMLLGNDTDPDRSDRVRLHAVDATSELGATLRLIKNDAGTLITEMVYDPTTSATLRGLATGERQNDRFSYEIVDPHGGVASATVTVVVTGEERFLQIAPIAPQVTLAGTPTERIAVVLDDPDGDPSDVELTAAAEDAQLVPASGIEVLRENGETWVRITPATGRTGRTWITLTARSGAAQPATTRFGLVAGTETDLDLDGVTGAAEDAGPHGGDSNQDGIPDRLQPHVTALRVADTNHFIGIAAEDVQFLAAVTWEDAPAAAADASNAQFPLDLLRFQVLGKPSANQHTVTLRPIEPPAALNRIFHLDPQQSWVSLMHNKRDGAQIYSDRIVISLPDGGRGDLDPAANQLHLALGLGHVERPWQNLVREDIDNDGTVTPIDALQLINQLNETGPRQLGSVPGANQRMPGFFDPSGSGSLEPIDALIVINFLNRRSSPEGEPSGVGATPLRWENPVPESELPAQLLRSRKKVSSRHDRPVSSIASDSAEDAHPFSQGKAGERPLASFVAETDAVWALDADWHEGLASELGALDQGTRQPLC